MPHIDDGILHAYLDGALDALSDAGELPQAMTAADVVSHLDACADCRARLRTERDTRERAGFVLGDAALPQVDVPAFAEIAGPSRVRRRTWVPMSWAASVLLALGAGWWGSEIWRAQVTTGTFGADEAISERSAPESTPPTAQRQSTVDAAAADARARESAGVTPLASVDTGPPRDGAQGAAPVASRFAPGDSGAISGEARTASAAFAAESALAGREEAYRRPAQPQMLPLGELLAGRSEDSARAIPPGRLSMQAGQGADVTATGRAAFNVVLARLESRASPLVSTPAAPSQTFNDPVFVISGASEPAVETAREPGQTTVRVRQTLSTGEQIEVVSWQLHSVALEEIFVTGRVGAIDSAAVLRLRSNELAPAQRRTDSTAGAPARAAEAPRAAESARTPPPAAPRRGDRTAEDAKAVDARDEPASATEPAFVVDGDGVSVRVLNDGRRELILRSAARDVWVALRADVSEAELRALMSRLVRHVPPR